MDILLRNDRGTVDPQTTSWSLEPWASKTGENGFGLLHLVFLKNHKYSQNFHSRILTVFYKFFEIFLKMFFQIRSLI